MVPLVISRLWLIWAAFFLCRGKVDFHSIIITKCRIYNLNLMSLKKLVSSLNLNRSTVEYLRPSFLVHKQNGGHRLVTVTAFGEVGLYSKPQPSLLPNVDSTLLAIGGWKYIIITDLLKSFYQILLSLPPPLDCL